MLQLPEPERTAALALPGAGPFNPMGEAGTAPAIGEVRLRVPWGHAASSGARGRSPAPLVWRRAPAPAGRRGSRHGWRRWRHERGRRRRCGRRRRGPRWRQWRGRPRRGLGRRRRAGAADRRRVLRAPRQTECQVAARCLTTMQSCVTERTGLCVAASAAARSGGRRYRPGNAQACVDKTASVYAKLIILPSDLTSLADVCGYVYQGDVALLGACATKYDCASATAVCDKGSCSERVMSPAGRRCGNPGEVCAVFSYCAQTAAGAFVCLTGDSSGRPATRRGSASKTCAAPRGRAPTGSPPGRAARIDDDCARRRRYWIRSPATSAASASRFPQRRRRAPATAPAAEPSEPGGRAAPGAPAGEASPAPEAASVGPLAAPGPGRGR